MLEGSITFSTSFQSLKGKFHAVGATKPSQASLQFTEINILVRLFYLIVLFFQCKILFDLEKICSCIS